MKLITHLLFTFLTLLVLTGCEDNLDDDNIPALQAVRNGEFFKSTQMTAVNNTDGTVSIIGVNRVERLEFILESAAAGTYPLGAGAANEAVYTFNDTDVFSTNEGNGGGQVVLSPNTPPGTLTGTFSFVSYLPNNADSLYMRKGVIFQVPFGDPIDGGSTGTASLLTADVDGTLFSPGTVTPVSGGGTVLVNATDSAGNSIVLSFPDNITVGMYTLAGSGNYTANYIVGGTADPAVSGNLEITAIDAAAGTITGVFDFMTGAPNNFSISNGTFLIYL